MLFSRHSAQPPPMSRPDARDWQVPNAPPGASLGGFSPGVGRTRMSMSTLRRSDSWYQKQEEERQRRQREKEDLQEAELVVDVIAC